MLVPVHSNRHYETATEKRAPVTCDGGSNAGLQPAVKSQSSVTDAILHRAVKANGVHNANWGQPNFVFFSRRDFEIRPARALPRIREITSSRAIVAVALLPIIYPPPRLHLGFANERCSLLVPHFCLSLSRINLAFARDLECNHVHW